jgi:hypothetical protein
LIATALAIGEGSDNFLSFDDAMSQTDSVTSSEGQSSAESGSSSQALTNRSLRQYYDEVAAIVDRLFDMSILIRGVKRNFRASRAAAHVERDAEGKAVLPEFRNIAYLKISGLAGQFAPVWLVNRLSDNVAMRRQQFYYQRAHQRHLSGNPTAFQDEAQFTSKPTPKPARGDFVGATTPVLSSANFKSPEVARTERSKSTAKTQETIATELISQAEPGETLSLAKPTRTEIVENIFPRPPKEPAGKAFECQQCYFILPATTRKEDLWRLNLL